MTRHPTKSTQGGDESEHKDVQRHVAARMGERRHDQDFSECLSRTIGASLVHSADNVTSPWLARHLISRKSRLRLTRAPRDTPQPHGRSDTIVLSCGVAQPNREGETSRQRGGRARDCST